MTKRTTLSLMILVIFSYCIYSQEIDRDFYINIIENDFIGVYLPVNYINELIETKNHSKAMHQNDNNKYHDVLIVNKNIIYSDLKWHDGYAIKAMECNSYQFIKNVDNRIIIDNNGFQYRRIGEDPSRAYYITQIFVIEIVFDDLIKQNIGISILGNKIILPFLHFFTEENIFSVELDDLFWEKGSSILLTVRGNQQIYFDLYMIINGFEYEFYKKREGRGPYSYKSETPFIHFNLNDDKEILIALIGLDENFNEESIRYLNRLSDYEKRKVINAMFALNGYSFITREWQNYFNTFSWYNPNTNVRNDPNILTTRQQRLLNYLNR